MMLDRDNLIEQALLDLEPNPAKRPRLRRELTGQIAVVRRYMSLDGMSEVEAKNRVRDLLAEAAHRPA